MLNPALHLVLSVPAPCFYPEAVPSSPLTVKGSYIYTVLKLHWLFEGNCEADVTPGENEFDTPAVAVILRFFRIPISLLTFSTYSCLLPTLPIRSLSILIITVLIFQMIIPTSLLCLSLLLNLALSLQRFFLWWGLSFDIPYNFFFLDSQTCTGQKNCCKSNGPSVV